MSWSLDKMRRGITGSLYHYQRRKQPDGGGAGKFAFQPHFSLEPFSLKAFPQFEVQQPMAVFQPPQVYAYNLVQLSGLGGLVPGNIVFQPLGQNPNGNNT